MHKVPDAPRRWLMPDQNIPFKRFKALHNRRLKSLSRLKSDIATTSSNPNPNLVESGEIEAEEGELSSGEGKESGGVDRIVAEVVVVKEEVKEEDLEVVGFWSRFVVVFCVMQLSCISIDNLLDLELYCIVLYCDLSD